jgi:hypothetical protein
VADIPRTISGKIVELAVRNVVHGEAVKNTDALANPEALALIPGPARASRLALLPLRWARRGNRGSIRYHCAHPRRLPLDCMFTSRTYHPDHDRQLALWLLTCAVVIYGMILLGGVTRLTESGLSMVEWRPIMGIVPPVGEAAWPRRSRSTSSFPSIRRSTAA